MLKTLKFYIYYCTIAYWCFWDEITMTLFELLRLFQFGTFNSSILCLPLSELGRLQGSLSLPFFQAWALHHILRWIMSIDQPLYWWVLRLHWFQTSEMLWYIAKSCPDFLKYSETVQSESSSSPCTPTSKNQTRQACIAIVTVGMWVWICICISSPKLSSSGCWTNHLQ